MTRVKSMPVLRMWLGFVELFPNVQRGIIGLSVIWLKTVVLEAFLSTWLNSIFQNALIWSSEQHSATSRGRESRWIHFCDRECFGNHQIDECIPKSHGPEKSEMKNSSQRGTKNIFFSVTFRTYVILYLSCSQDFAMTHCTFPRPLFLLALPLIESISY